MKKVVVGLHVCHDHLDHIIGAAGGLVAFHHFRSQPHGLLEILDHSLGMPQQRNVRETADSQSQFAAIDDRGIAHDVAAVFQFLLPTPARTGRHTDLLGQFAGGNPGIFLQLDQDLLRCRIER